MGSQPIRGRRALAALLCLAGMAAIGAAGCSAGGASSGDAKLSLVAFSVPKPAYQDLEKAFAETATGKGVTWKESYGASGDQSRAVASGLKADVVAFSLTSDMTRLVDKGQVASNWDANPTKGIVSDSVVVIAFRKGNPKHISGWDDLIKPGVKIVTPNPGSSGSARWNILAAYAQVLSRGGSEADAQTYLTKFYKNIVSLPASGREATSAFVNGTGDVLISYENEAIAARQSGAALDYIVPNDTFLIENPAAVTKNASPKAQQFLQFALSKNGQEIFAKHGFRPIIHGVNISTVQGANDPSNPFPTVQHLTTAADLGGWSAINKKFFDDKDGLVTKIQQAAGVG